MNVHSRRQKRIDRASGATLVLTVVLFSLSLIEKGFTHELLLEAGVFLVSVKLVLASHRGQIDVERLNEKLDRLLANSPRRKRSIRYSNERVKDRVIERGSTGPSSKFGSGDRQTLEPSATRNVAPDRPRERGRRTTPNL